MRTGYSYRRRVLDIAAPRVNTLCMTTMRLTTTHNVQSTWGIGTDLTARATRGLFATATTANDDLDLRATGGVLTQMATYYRIITQDLQQSEATTARRYLLTQVGTAEAKTVYVSKAGAAFVGAGGTATVLDATLFRVEPTAADLDTLGPIAYKLQGATDTDYVYGMRVVSHDPYADIAAILSDTGTDGVPLIDSAITAAKFGANAITYTAIADGALRPENFSGLAQNVGCEVQLSEATTARRTVLYMVGTNETQTITISKAGGAFAGCSSTATCVSGTEFALTLATADLDTLGELVVKSEGATNTQYIHGIRVVQHDPYTDPHIVRRAVAGKVVTDTSDNTIKIYDADNASVLVTLTKTTSGTASTWNAS